MGVVVLTTLLRTFVAQAFYVDKVSMTPQLRDRDRIVVSKLSYRLHPPRRGDIVVLDAPDDQRSRRSPPLPRRALDAVLQGVNVVRPAGTEFVKRVIGLPGEEVAGRNGSVYIDGKLLVEPYLPTTARTPAFGPTRVPPGMLYVLGDNRAASYDSTEFGPIPRGSVVGRVVLRVWPLPNASWL